VIWMSNESTRAALARLLQKPDLAAPPWRKIAWAIGPGIVVMLADTDTGNVAAQAGVQWRYRLLPLVLGLVPMLYMAQELTVRLGIFTGRGHGDAGLLTFRSRRRDHRFIPCHAPAGLQSNKIKKFSWRVWLSDYCAVAPTWTHLSTSDADAEFKSHFLPGDRRTLR